MGIYRKTNGILNKENRKFIVRMKQYLENTNRNSVACDMAIAQVSTLLDEHQKEQKLDHII